MGLHHSQSGKFRIIQLLICTGIGMDLQYHSRGNLNTYQNNLNSQICQDNWLNPLWVRQILENLLKMIAQGFSCSLKNLHFEWTDCAHFNNPPTVGQYIPIQHQDDGRVGTHWNHQTGRTYSIPQLQTGDRLKIDSISDASLFQQYIQLSSPFRSLGIGSI